MKLKTLKEIFLDEMSLSEWNKFQIEVAKKVAKLKKIDVRQLLLKSNFTEVFAYYVNRGKDHNDYDIDKIASELKDKVKRK